MCFDEAVLKSGKQSIRPTQTSIKHTLTRDGSQTLLFLLPSACGHNKAMHMRDCIVYRGGKLKCKGAGKSVCMIKGIISLLIMT